MTASSRSLRIAAAVALLLGAVAPRAEEPGPRQIDLPPITATPTGVFHPGKVVWFDLLTHDPATAQAFYGGVLGWTFEGRGDYSVARDASGPVAGILKMAPPASGRAPSPARWMPLVSVTDLAKAVAAVKAQGGRLLEGPSTLGPRGRYAAVADPRGAQLVLFTSATGDPPDTDGPPPGWIWAELWTDDMKAAASFYKAVLGYEVWTVGSGKNQGFLLAGEGRPRARGARIPFAEVPPQWLPYVVVPDLKGALARVKQLGGQVLRRAGKEQQVAAVADPAGAVMVLEQRPAAPEVALKPAPATAPTPGGTAAGAAAAAPTESADPYGIGAAQERNAAETAAQAAPQGGVAGADVTLQGSPEATVVVPGPSPFATVWIAPPAWGPYWGPGWMGPPGWIGPSWWGGGGWWGPYYRPPPYYGPRPPYGGGGYPAPPRYGGGGYPAPPRYGGGSSPGGRPAPPVPRAAPAPAPAPRAAPAPAPRGSAAPHR
jgi:hypothetical protein